MCPTPQTPADSSTSSSEDECALGNNCQTKKHPASCASPPTETQPMLSPATSPSRSKSEGLFRPPPQMAGITAGASEGYFLCPRYSATQSCEYGDECKFAHGELELAYWISLKGRKKRNSPVVASRQPARPPPNQVGLIRAPETFVLCRHYSRGFCRMDRDCRFAHGVDELNHWNTVTGKPAQTQDDIKHQIEINEAHDTQHRLKKQNEQLQWVSKNNQHSPPLPAYHVVFPRSNSAPTAAHHHPLPQRWLYLPLSNSSPGFPHQQPQSLPHWYVASPHPNIISGQQIYQLQQQQWGQPSHSIVIPRTTPFV